MPTKAEIEEALAQLEADHEQTVAQLEALQAEHAEKMQAAVETIAALRAALDAASQAKPAPETIPVGSIPAPGQLLVLTDATIGEAGWISRTGGNRDFIVDIVGPQAEFYCKITRLPYVATADGFRIHHVPQQQAQVLAEQIRKQARSSEHQIHVEVMSSASTFFLARKATEGGARVGSVPFGNHGRGYAVAVPSKAVPMSVSLGADGRPTTLHLHLSA